MHVAGKGATLVVFMRANNVRKRAKHLREKQHAHTLGKLLYKKVRRMSHGGALKGPPVAVQPELESEPPDAESKQKAPQRRRSDWVGTSEFASAMSLTATIGEVAAVNVQNQMRHASQSMRKWAAGRTIKGMPADKRVSPASRARRGNGGLIGRAPCGRPPPPR